MWCMLSSLQTLRSFELGRTTLMYNAALEALCRAKQWKLALGLYGVMLDEQQASSSSSSDSSAKQLVKPDQFTYTQAIRACSRAGNWQRAVQLHDDMISGTLLSLFKISTLQVVYINAHDDSINNVCRIQST
jgi:pentatricopeptide repeat protein